MRRGFFFEVSGPLTLGAAASLTGAELAAGADPAREILGAAPLERSAPGDLVFLDNTKYLDALATTRASACLVARRHAARVPPGTAALVTPEPYRAMAKVMAVLYPAALRPGAIHAAAGIAAGAHVHPGARLEAGVVVDPGVVVGPGAEIGARTVIAAGAVIGPGVKIGRDGSIGAGATLAHALVGDRVIIHPGARIGQDGFGFAMGPSGHLKVPQIGRVIVQDDVEIGANTTIDRGANRDTVVGEGTKIDNLVQIGHNVMIGRHCVIVAQVGIAGSSVLEDFVAIGGQSGVIGHVRIGMGAQIAAASNVAGDVPAGGRWGGTPAKPVREWFREVTALKKLGERRGGTAASGTEAEDGR